MNDYIVLKLVHIIAAILAVGFNFTYPVWLFKGRKEEGHLLFSLEGIRFLDNWIANPSYIISLLSGLAMCYVGNISLLEFNWATLGLMIYLVMSIVGFGFYTPLLNKQIRALKEFGPQSSAYQMLDKMQSVLGGLLFLLASAVVLVMILKPGF